LDRRDGPAVKMIRGSAGGESRAAHAHPVRRV